MNHINTQVGIIGAGPAGLTLALLLRKTGISSVIIERHSQDYIESRVRAGLLEQNTVDIMQMLKVDERLKNEGQAHHGVYLSFNGQRKRIHFDPHTDGRHITIYGQQEVVKDMAKAYLDGGGAIYFEAEAKAIDRINTKNPRIQFLHQGINKAIDCDFVAGCDGFHGISRSALPKNSYKVYEKTYPFGWLGILAHVAPSTDELIYAYHENGFALHSLRSESVSRLYLQVEHDDDIANWADEKIWDELATRLSCEGWSLKRGPVFDKSITPMRSFMIDNMQHGRLFLAGDAAHIVPPTGGKGLNLAVADIRHLSEALTAFYHEDLETLLNDYSAQALKRIWRAQEFSNFMTRLLHKQAPHGSFQYRLQKARFDYLCHSLTYQSTFAENYVGLPFGFFEIH